MNTLQLLSELEAAATHEPLFSFIELILASILSGYLGLLLGANDEV